MNTEIDKSKKTNIKLALRVSSGLAKNKRLEVPQIEGFRAVQEVAKLALFSILGEKIENAQCLDLFAGSGNLGIEALSRGAQWCNFVDANYESTEVIEKNLNNCGFLANAEITLKDSLKYVLSTSKKYDIVFLDPFYENTSLIHLFKNLGNILKEEGIVCFFHSETTDPNLQIKDASLEIIDDRKFGKSYLTLLKAKKGGKILAQESIFPPIHFAKRPKRLR